MKDRLFTQLNNILSPINKQLDNDLFEYIYGEFIKDSVSNQCFNGIKQEIVDDIHFEGKF